METPGAAHDDNNIIRWCSMLTPSKQQYKRSVPKMFASLSHPTVNFKPLTAHFGISTKRERGTTLIVPLFQQGRRYGRKAGNREKRRAGDGPDGENPLSPQCGKEHPEARPVHMDGPEAGRFSSHKNSSHGEDKLQHRCEAWHTGPLLFKRGCSSLKLLRSALGQSNDNRPDVPSPFENPGLRKVYRFQGSSLTEG